MIDCKFLRVQNYKLSDILQNFLSIRRRLRYGMII